MSKKYYSAGFLFSEDHKRVALIRKNKPEWQAGRLNAIGGKIEDGETPGQAMNREFIEEAGIDVTTFLSFTNWDNFAFLEGPDWSCHFYRAFGDPELCESKTDEIVKVFEVEKVKLMNRPEVIGNIPWLLSLALDITGGVVFPVHIKYDG